MMKSAEENKMTSYHVHRRATRRLATDEPSVTYAKPGPAWTRFNVARRDRQDQGYGSATARKRLAAPFSAEATRIMPAKAAERATKRIRPHRVFNGLLPALVTCGLT
jgi:hypothetical protein